MRHRILTADDLPSAVLRAAVLHGEAYPVGGSWASIAEPDDAGLRAAAFVVAVDDPQLVAAGTTAAWIWGALSRAPVPVSAAARPGRRVRRGSSATLAVQELALRRDDVVAVGGATVTTPVRTVVDLVRGRAPYDAEAERAVAALLRLDEVGQCGTGPGDVDLADRARARILATPRAPGSRRALTRLDALAH